MTNEKELGIVLMSLSPPPLSVREWVHACVSSYSFDHHVGGSCIIECPERACARTAGWLHALFTRVDTATREH